MIRTAVLVVQATTFALLGVATAQATAWSVTYRDSIALDTSTTSVSELSGVTYLGPATSPGKHRFASIQDGGGLVITIEAEFGASANLVSAAAVDSLALNLASGIGDLEGIAYTGTTTNTVYISDENDPGVREYDLLTGNQQDVVSIPAVFGNIAGNRGFESLSRSADGSVMWTANEEALTVDGALSNATTGSTVRLLQLEESGGSYEPGSQFAYVTESKHGSEIELSRSGLSDLVVLPDGTLLALERSFAGAFPLYLSSIFEVDFEGATDISDVSFDSGLIADPNYSVVAKNLLWSGSASGIFGVNLEGLALGPRLANGNWVLFGVSDDSASSTITTWELAALPNADFDGDGEVAGTDFLAWQRGSGTSIGAAFSQGDADRDGDVDSDDLAVWSSSYGSTLTRSSLRTVPECSSWLLFFSGANAFALLRFRWLSITDCNLS